MIDHIKISGYKSFREVDMHLTPINILIGANGSGKSNFISFFEFLSNLSEQKLQQHIALGGGEDKIFHKGTHTTTTLGFEIRFNNDVDIYLAELEMASEGLIFNTEAITQFTNRKQNIPAFGRESKLKETDSAKARHILQLLKSFRKYHFHDTGKNSPFTKMSHIENDKFFLYEDGSNLAAFLYNIKETHLTTYNRIIKVIQSIAPFFSDFFLQPNSEGYLRLQWQDKFSSTVYGVNDLSDGSMRFIALCVLFMQPQMPSTIIIDEPELGLHPSAIAKLAGMFNIASRKSTQIIASTQSADLINHFAPEQIITVDQKEGESLLVRLNGPELSIWLDEYGIGDLWQRSLINGGQPK
ncbi:AAA family ATPase [Marinilabilia salmonicolor]|uniref:Putative ATPase n=1 Tax=Marinilabilia salmonicolor TaxID=989 RepID=A0A368V921_9BACT|nr:AAA family ATPase [Marinilabilia salmonicolor]RCW36765.1 putative ATPase [Marinilabilia salmonicolor]